MGAATARLRPERGERQAEEVAPAKSKRSAAGESSGHGEVRLTGQLVLIALITVAALFGTLTLRITLQNDAGKVYQVERDIDIEAQAHESLAAEVAIKAASPKIRQNAIDDLGMKNASQVYYVKEGVSVTSSVLATDMKYLDRSGKKIRTYKKKLARAKLEKARAAAAARAASESPAAVPATHATLTSTGSQGAPVGVAAQ